MRSSNGILLIFALLIVLCSCSHRRDPRLQFVSEIVSDNPERAMSILDSIDTRELSERDMAYYNLMTIKARDKAYITHTSDSLIREVLDYYENHPGMEEYDEALYYGGRVYSNSSLKI